MAYVELTEEQSQVIKALDTHLDQYLTDKHYPLIAAEYGDEVASAVKNLYEDTVGCDVDWSKANVDDGLAVMATVINSKYPWLPDRIRHKLVGVFVIAWK